MSYGFLSNRVKRRDQSGITSDRYEFLGLDQAEPDLGDPLIGPSSVTANPFTGDVTNLYFVASDGSGSRYWTKQTDVVAGGVITPGSITVRDEGVVVGSVNQVTDINFVGSGVTITSPASWVGAGSSSVDIQISVTDVTGAGNAGNIQYKGSSGFLEGSNDLFYNSSTQRLGLGTAIPTQKLDVRGNVFVSGIITANSITANSFTVDNFKINEEVLQFIVTSDAVGIGTTQPIATLDVRGTANITGVATIATVSTPRLLATNANISGVTTTGSISIGTTEVISSARQLKNIASLDAVTLATIESAIAAAPNTFNDLNVTGIGTIQSLRSPNASFTGVTTTVSLNSDFATIGIATITGLGVTTITSGFSTSTNSWVSGVSTITTADINVALVDRVEATSIGIGTTNPRQELDVVGDIRLSGAIYDFNGSSGSSGQVLISNGTSPVAWGSPGSIVAGSATSVTITDTNTNGYYYLTFVPGKTGNQGINIDGSWLVYNPSTNNLGIGSTTPKVELDVVGNANITGIATFGNINIQGLTRLNSGIVTTINRNTVVIDSFDTSQFRSARYSLQITTDGRLIPGTGSVSLLEGGTNYSPGVYEDVPLISSNGIGTDGKATIVIQPEATLGITSSHSGLFFTNSSTIGIETGQTIYFDKTVFVSDRDDSTITALTLSSGVGYTVFPTVSIDSPIIAGNPVQGVGVGSTAEVRIDSLKVSNVVLNSGTGLVATTIPTVSFASPVGVGTSATGLVGFGISTITVTSSGSGYYSIPSVVVSGNATAQVSGIFVSSIDINNIGSGYTAGNFPVAITVGAPAIGVNTARITQSSFSIANDFTISSAGTGYTAVPTLTVSSPSIGVNTATVTCTLGITTFTVGAGGSAYGSSPSLNLSQTPTGFLSRVGLGISDYLIQVNGGSGYGGGATVTFNAVGGIGTGAQAEFQAAPGGVLQDFVITNPGYGYTVPPTVTVTGAGVGAAVTIRTMVVTDVTVIEDGYGLTSVPTATLSNPTTQISDLVVSRQGTVGIATTTRLSSIVISNQGTLSIASTTIISGISTFTPLQYIKTGNLDQASDTSITGINTDNIRVGQGVTGTYVSTGTTVTAVLPSEVYISVGTTNLTAVASNTFYFNDNIFESVQVGQGVTGNFISAGSTVVSIGASTVRLSLPAFNTGVSTNTYYFGPIQTVAGIGATTIITGITTTSIVVGQGVTGTNVPSSTLVSGIGTNNTVTISQATTHTGLTTQTFYFSTLSSIVGSGASVTPLLGIGNVTVVGYGTGYLNTPGIAVTANNGITGGGGIVTTRSLGITTGCLSITNAGTGYTNVIPSVTFGSPTGAGSTTTGTLGIGVSAITVTSQGSGYTSSKPTITFSGGSGGAGLAATVTNIVISGVSISNAGYGYTAADLPLTPTFSNVGLAGSTGFGIYSVTVTKPGLGYTVTPTVSISTSATLGSASNATITPTLGYDSSYDLSPGPGYGGVQVYYIQPQSANTFRISTNSNGTGPIVLGYSTSNSPSAIVGGEVTSVTITEPGSGYLIGDTIQFQNSSFDISYDTNVGVGFSFVVANTYEDFQVSDILMLQTVGSATSETHIIEYAGISNQESLGEYSSDISGMFARLKFTPTHANNTVKLSRTSITN